MIQFVAIYFLVTISQNTNHIPGKTMIMKFV